MTAPSPTTPQRSIALLLLLTGCATTPAVDRYTAIEARCAGADVRAPEGWERFCWQFVRLERKP